MSTNGNLDAYLNVCKNCTFHRLFHFTFHKFHICRLVGEARATCLATPTVVAAYVKTVLELESLGIGLKELGGQASKCLKFSTGIEF